MATCQVWRLATVALPWAGWVAAVAMAPLARRRWVGGRRGDGSARAQALCHFTIRPNVMGLQRPGRSGGALALGRSEGDAHTNVGGAGRRVGDRRGRGE